MLLQGRLMYPFGSMPHRNPCKAPPSIPLHIYTSTHMLRLQWPRRGLYRKRMRAPEDTVKSGYQSGNGSP